MPTSPLAVPVSLAVVLAGLAAGCASSSSASTANPSKPADPSRSMEFPVKVDGKSAGTLRLGQTTLTEAKQMLPPPPPGTDGQPRTPDGYPRPASGEVIPRPTLVYNPQNTSYQLFFDANQRLVVFVDGSSTFLGKPVAEVTRQYPELHESVRELPFSEQQAPIAPCTTLMVMASTSDSTVSAVAYDFTCATQPP